jgi:hypothetical protein
LCELMGVRSYELMGRKGGGDHDRMLCPNGRPVSLFPVIQASQTTDRAREYEEGVARRASWLRLLSKLFYRLVCPCSSRRNGGVRPTMPSPRIATGPVMIHKRESRGQS